MLIAISAVAIVVFVLLANLVLTGKADAFDVAVARAIRGTLDSPAGDVMFELVTYVGSWPTTFVVSALTALFAVRRRHLRTACLVMVNPFAAQALNKGLKEIVARARPDLDPVITPPESYSFPSGHALVSLAVYGLIVAVIIRLVPRSRVPVILVASLLVLGTGLSRVYLGVHWPLDVLAGYTAGVPLLAVTLHLARKLDARDVEQPKS
jgi:undecaprenyl-diphosphatase